METKSKWYVKRINSLKREVKCHKMLNLLQTMVIVALVVCCYNINTEKDSWQESYKLAVAENERLELNLDATTQLYYSEIENTTNVLEKLEESTALVTKLTAQLEEAEEYINTNMVCPENKKYNRDTDLGITTVMTTDRMNRIIDYWLDRNNGHNSSPFNGQGEAFITASKESGLDPVFIFALASHESNFGRSKLATNKQNYMGIGAFDSSPYTSALTLGSTFEEGIIANACWVADKYYNQGQTTLNKMIYGKKQYSTSADSWISAVSSIMSVSNKID